MLDIKQIMVDENWSSTKLNSERGSLFRFSISNSLLFLFFILCSFSTIAQVTSSVDSTKIRIGEEILYTINVDADSTDVVVFPEGQTFGPLEMIESYKTETTFEASKTKIIKRYGLTQFDSGNYTIPPQRIIINNKPFLTDSVRIEVNTVAIDTTKQKMFDIKPAIEIDTPPFDWLKIIYWIIPLILVVVLAIYLFRRKKRKDAAKKQLPPYEEAIVALQKLDNSQLLKENKSKEYYSNLTEIVKRYLDREVDESALESTSDELITRLMMHKDAGNFDFSNETIRKLDQIFKRADLVKFARMNQEYGQAEVDRKNIEEIINETHEVIPEPTEEELLKDKEYLEKLQKRKQRKKWIIGVSGVLALLILAGVAYGGITGFDNLKDKIFGNDLRELAEGRWVKSEYGYPAVIIETPEVLVRIDSPITNAENSVVSGKDIFSYGQMNSPLHIAVSTTQFRQQQDIDLDSALDAVLDDLEQSGAKNLLVKRDDFETNKGIKGLRAYGEFNVQVSDNRVLKEKSTYELMLFAQQNGLQKVLIVYQDDGKYAEEIKSRIEASIELEITGKDGQ
ncbi:MAG TPA: BatD family protein [Aequorivita sp.]|nr:BatD family protein [Aequorivita sp.]